MESLRTFNSKQIPLTDRCCCLYVSMRREKEEQETNRQVWKLAFTPRDIKCLKNGDPVSSMLAHQMPCIPECVGDEEREMTHIGRWIPRTKRGTGGREGTVERNPGNCIGHHRFGVEAKGLDRQRAGKDGSSLCSPRRFFFLTSYYFLFFKLFKMYDIPPTYFKLKKAQ